MDVESRSLSDQFATPGNSRCGARLGSDFRAALALQPSRLHRIIRMFIDSVEVSLWAAGSPCTA